jgi:malate dehydrogenase (oxaloacetate-decarboxylating)
MNPAKEDIAKVTNRQKKKGSLADVMKGADIFLGISGPGLVTKEMVRSMAPDPIIFAMANPTPEIFPEEAKEAGASVIATGRSDYPNQINNCLGFPGIFRGALDVRATCVNEAMKIAAAKALAELVKDDELTPEYIIPGALDPRVVPAVAESVARAAKESGVAR